MGAGASATLTTIGFYRYGENTVGVEPLFSEMKVPDVRFEDGSLVIDKNILIDRLLFQVGEREVYFSNYHIMREAIKRWSESYLFNWTKLAETMVIKYNPIWNTDKLFKERLERDFDYTTDDSTTGSGTSTHDATETGSESDNQTRNLTTSETDKLSVMAYNVNSFTDRELRSKNGTEAETVGSTRNTSDTLDEDSGFSESGTLDRDQTEKGVQTIERTEQGNFGIYMTTQKMINEEREVALFSLYDIIIDSYADNFCLLIYF